MRRKLRTGAEKYLQEQARRLVGSGWKAGKDFFFLLRQKNIFVLTSLQFWGEKGSRSQPSKEAQSHVYSGKARQGRVLTWAMGLKGALTLVGFQDLCFEFNELFGTFP